MRRWLDRGRWVQHRTIPAVAALVLGACGASAAHTAPGSPTSSSATSSPATSSPASSSPASSSPATSSPATSSPDSSASSQSATPSPTGSPPCGPAAGRTLAEDRRARIYVAGGRIFGCARGGGRRFALGQQGSCLSGPAAGPFSVKGVRAAFGVKRCGVDTGTSSVVVRKLDDGRVIADHPATSSPLGAESFVDVTSIVLSRSGAVGWIAAAGSIVSHRRVIEVHLADAHGVRRLDSGTAIAVRSLRLRGSQLHWVHAGRQRTVRVS